MSRSLRGFFAKSVYRAKDYSSRAEFHIFHFLKSSLELIYSKVFKMNVVRSAGGGGGGGSFKHHNGKIFLLDDIYRERP